MIKKSTWWQIHTNRAAARGVKLSNKNRQRLWSCWINYYCERNGGFSFSNFLGATLDVELLKKELSDRKPGWFMGLEIQQNPWVGGTITVPFDVTETESEASDQMPTQK